ncbi:MAG TPA: hypothetical protein VFM24_08815 [Nitrospira sp.]|nr:hypothetical protein [Nitrospira sp.]
MTAAAPARRVVLLIGGTWGIKHPPESIRMIEIRRLGGAQT